MAADSSRKPRFLCLHGFRTSGEIMKKQIHKWPESVLSRLDLVYLDGPSPAQGKSNVEGIFDPPYYEWFQTNKSRLFKVFVMGVKCPEIEIQDQSVYYNFEKCLDYIEDFMIKNGPFDGLLGFSQGAYLSAALPGLQAQGVALKKVPKIKYLIIVSGAKMKDMTWAENAYAAPIQCPSLHILGKEDFLKTFGEELLECCVDPMVIHHPKGHTVPRLDEESLSIMLSYIDKIQKSISEEVRYTDVPHENGKQMNDIVVA